MRGSTLPYNPMTGCTCGPGPWDKSNIVVDVRVLPITVETDTGERLEVTVGDLVDVLASVNPEFFEKLKLQKGLQNL